MTGMGMMGNIVHVICICVSGVISTPSVGLKKSFWPQNFEW